MFASVIIFSIAALLKKGIKVASPVAHDEIWINRCAGAIKRSTSFPICLSSITFAAQFENGPRRARCILRPNSLTFTCSHMRPKFGAAWPAFHSSFCFVRRFHRLHTHPSRFKTNAGHLTLFHRPIIPLEKMFAAKGEKVFHTRELEIFEFTQLFVVRTDWLFSFWRAAGEISELHACMRDACCRLAKVVKSLSRRSNLHSREGTECQCFVAVRLRECLSNAFCTSLLWLAQKHGQAQASWRLWENAALHHCWCIALNRKLTIVWKVWMLLKKL